jgi:hypothetical protein
VTQLLTVAGAASGLLAALSVALLSIRAAQRTSFGRRAVDDLLDTFLWLGGLGRPGDMSNRPRRFTMSSRLLGLAVRRLPGGMAEAEKDRWEEEMAADLAAVGGPLRRLLFALRLWRTGAPGLEATGEAAPRSAGD